MCPSSILPGFAALPIQPFATVCWDIVMRRLIDELSFRARVALLFLVFVAAMFAIAEVAD
jgi:hypothetical protein